MKDDDKIYLFATFSPYDNDGDRFVEKYEKDHNSVIKYIGMDDDVWPDGTYHDILGRDAWGDCQYVITTTYGNLKTNGWLDDLIYQCEKTAYHED